MMSFRGTKRPLVRLRWIGLFFLGMLAIAVVQIAYEFWTENRWNFENLPAIALSFSIGAAAFYFINDMIFWIGPDGVKVGVPKRGFRRMRMIPWSDICYFDIADDLKAPEAESSVTFVWQSERVTAPLALQDLTKERSKVALEVIKKYWPDAEAEPRVQCDRRS
ncbi:MAG: hypothetical protein ACRBB0_20855 [Pelagimonas sp.]|uniref:hypothetical protein n=1 Tax=Pelagimonas sp. TaxID=2073170 RepID=UPI003D6BC1C9